MNNRRKGSIREHLAAAYLAKQGLEILEYNYRTARGKSTWWPGRGILWCLWR